MVIELEATGNADDLLSVVEPWGGLVLRWCANDACLLFDPSGAWIVWRGRVISRVVVDSVA